MVRIITTPRYESRLPNATSLRRPSQQLMHWKETKFRPSCCKYGSKDSAISQYSVVRYSLHGLFAHPETDVAATNMSQLCRIIVLLVFGVRAWGNVRGAGAISYALGTATLFCGWFSVRLAGVCRPSNRRSRPEILKRGRHAEPWPRLRADQLVPPRPTPVTRWLHSPAATRGSSTLMAAPSR